MSRVISYIRFSSKRQEKGDSKRRQLQMAVDYCLKHGLVLDTEFRLDDLGLSAYSGAHVKRGALGVLQAMCINNEIEEGTILLIEAFDRMTRLPLPEAVELLLSLVNNGLTVVTLVDEKVWSKETMKSLEAFMLSIMKMYQGFSESDRKSEMLRKTFKRHRETQSTQAFGTAPGWLSREDKLGPWLVDEDKAETVRKVFELSAAGFGSKAIAKQANAEQWPVPTRLNKTEGRWHALMPGLILRNTAVLGEHTHRIRTHESNAQFWQGHAAGDVVKDYYPQIVSHELWFQSRASVETRKVAKRKGTHYFNVFSGLMFCGQCGAPVQRKAEQGAGRSGLICADKIGGFTKCRTMAAHKADATIIESIYMMSPEKLSAEASTAGDELAALSIELNDKQKELDNITSAIAQTGGSIQSFIVKAQELDDELQTLKVGYETKQVEIALEASGDSSSFDTAFVDQALSSLYVISDEAMNIRVKLHMKLSRLVETVWMFAYECAVVKYHGSPVFHVIPLGTKVRGEPQELLREALGGVTTDKEANGLKLPAPRRGNRT